MKGKTVADYAHLSGEQIRRMFYRCMLGAEWRPCVLREAGYQLQMVLVSVDSLWIAEAINGGASKLELDIAKVPIAEPHHFIGVRPLTWADMDKWVLTILREGKGVVTFLEESSKTDSPKLYQLNGRPVEYQMTDVTDDLAIAILAHYTRLGKIEPFSDGVLTP